jgi:hypothetical protein
MEPQKREERKKWRQKNCLNFDAAPGCQMVYFQTKNPNLGKFWEGLAVEAVGIFYGYLVYFTAI